MKNFTAIAIPSLVILMAAAALIWLSNENKDLHGQRQSLLKTNSDLEQVYLNVIRMQWSLEGKTVSNETKLVNKNNDTFMLNSLVGLSSKPSFVLNFNWDACQDCIQQEI